MRISDHYKAFEKKTVIALTNNERCRLLIAHHREIEEVEGLASPEFEHAERITAAHASTKKDIDDMKDNRLVTLYSAISEKLRTMIDHDGVEEVLICVPEINKNILIDALHADVKKALLDTVPKNLASMDLNNIVRILMEG
ncbi:hypothetical protein KBC55_03465 [Patescibacteria group bacterium]|jgi:hypothetical protein|nr:hypothetical protein [Patescibacteria group bacterium]